MEFFLEKSFKFWLHSKSDGPLSLLAVVGARAVLAQEMLVEQRLRNGIRCGVDLKGFHGHLGDDFEGERVFDRLGSGGSPGEGSVSMHQDGADLLGIEVAESFNDDIAGFPFVSARISSGVIGRVTGTSP